MTRAILVAAIASSALPACGEDAPNACAGDGYLGYLGEVPNGDECRDCESDRECAGLYGGDVGDGCAAYCASACFEQCPDECTEIPAGGCTPGERECGENELVYVCDPTCGPSGGCRACATDAECELELGDGASCDHHCGNCCQPDDPSTCGCF